MSSSLSGMVILSLIASASSTGSERLNDACAEELPGTAPTKRPVTFTWTWWTTGVGWAAEKPTQVRGFNSVVRQASVLRAGAALQGFDDGGADVDVVEPFDALHPTGALRVDLHHLVADHIDAYEVHAVG